MHAGTKARCPFSSRPATVRCTVWCRNMHWLDSQVTRQVQVQVNSNSEICTDQTVRWQGVSFLQVRWTLTVWFRSAHWLDISQTVRRTQTVIYKTQHVFRHNRWEKLPPWIRPGLAWPPSLATFLSQKPVTLGYRLHPSISITDRSTLI